MRDLAFITDPEGRCHWVSRSVQEALGWTLADLSGRKITDLYHPDDLRILAAQIPDIAAGMSLSWEGRMLHADGTYLWFRGQSRSIQDSSGKQIGRLGIVTNIQDLRDAQDLLITAIRLTSEALLRPVPARIRGLDLAVRYSSAHGFARIGGDFYEVVDTGDRILMVLGDVRGKGLPALRLASAATSAFRESAYRDGNLASALTMTDRAIRRESGPIDFATALFLAIDPQTGHAEVISAGHPAPHLRTTTGWHEIDVKPSVPLGLRPEFRPTHLRLEPGDALLAFTDGLTEARSPAGDEFALADHLPHDSRSLGALVDRVFSAVTVHTQHTMVDDIALLAIGRPSSPERRRTWPL